MLAVCPQAAHPPADHRAVRRLSSPSESDPTTVRPDYPTLSLSLVAAQQPRASRRTATRQPPRTWLRAQPHRCTVAWPTRVLRCLVSLLFQSLLTPPSHYLPATGPHCGLDGAPPPSRSFGARSPSQLASSDQRAVRRPRSVRVPLATWRCFFMRWICSAGAIKEPKGQRQDKMMAFVNWMTFAAARP